MSVHALLNPSAAQQKAWQLLGYKRYVSRAAVRAYHEHIHVDNAEPLVDAPPTSVNSLQPNLVHSEIVHSEIAHREARSEKVLPNLAAKNAAQSAAAKPAIAQTAPVIRAIDFGVSQLLPLSSASIIYNAEQALLLPLLHWQAGSWRLFAAAEEGQLLHSAFLRMGYPQAAAMLAPLLDWQTDAAPQAAAVNTEISSRLRDKTWCYLGNPALASVGAALFAQAGKSLTHPALALRSGEHKRQLWQQLLQLRGYFS